MIRFFKELYLTGFTLSFRLGGSAWTPLINAGKGVVGVALIEWIILLGIAGLIETLLGTRFSLDFNRWVIRVAFLAIYCANYYVLVTRGHGIRFEQDFANLNKSRKILLLTSCVVLMLAAVALFIHSGLAHRQRIGVQG